MKTIEVKMQRSLETTPDKAFDAWLDPKTPGTPWFENNGLIFNPEVNGLWYWLIRDNVHYGRFTEISKPSRVQTKWMSKHTAGEETTVTVTFEKKGSETLMTLVHTGLPDTDGGRGHEKGWNYFLDKLTDQLGRK